MRKVNRIGEVFGRLVVIADAPSKRSGQSKRPQWKCLCECGRIKILLSRQLTHGSTKSCGCWQAEYRHIQKANFQHGHNSRPKCSPTYSSWAAMRGRCEYPNMNGYKNYGGRGINVCERWKDFKNFLADMGERPSLDYSIERVNVNGNYEPKNCAWLLKRDQWKNTRKNAGYVLACLDYDCRFCGWSSVENKVYQTCPRCDEPITGYLDE